MTQGLKNLQDSATYKRTAENLQFAKDIAKEKTSGIVSGIAASGYFQSMSSKMSEAYEAAKTKMTTSMSQQTFDEALNEHNGSAATTPSEPFLGLINTHTCTKVKSDTPESISIHLTPKICFFSFD